jgi:polysaccharide biosynthesis transport protein
MAQIGETELDLGALSRALWRRAWLLILLAVLAAVGTWYALGFVEPLYTADTSILIEERESPLTRPRDEGAASSETFDESAIQSQVELLRSREIAEAVIDKLDLTSRPEFDPARRPSIVRSLLVMLGLSENPADADIRQRVMEGYFERISVYPLQRSRVIGVEFSASDPTMAADVANAIAEAFVDLQQDAKRESAVAATAWLEQEIERLRTRVAEAEQAVAEYRESHQLFDVERGGGVAAGSLSTQQLSDLSAELIRARAARAEAEARAEQVQSLLDDGVALESSEQVLSSQLVQRLRERQGALRAQIAELSTTLLPTHPRIRSLEGQVANLELQIRQEAEKVLASLNTAARVAAAREQSLVDSLNEAKGVVSRSNEEAIELRALEREATAQRDLLESFLGRYREAIARTDANYLPADARVISRAVAPREPSFPKKAMMSVAAAVAMLLIATALLLLREFVSGRAFRMIGYAMPPATAAAPDRLPVPVPYAPMTVEAEKAAPPSGPADAETTDDRGDDEDAEPSAPLASDAEAPRVAEASDEIAPEEQRATQAVIDSEDDDRPGTVEIADLLANPGVRLALFAGADGDEGAGDIAYSTAVLAAEKKLRCILIDIGSVASEALGNERPGLGDLLAGDAAFGEVIRRDDESGVHVIPKGSAEKDPPIQRIQLVIGALTHTYDKVIVVAEKLDDWPHEHVHPDLAAIVCGPDTTELFRTELYESALARGAHNALIVRFTGEPDGANGEKESAAA